MFTKQTTMHHLKYIAWWCRRYFGNLHSIS